MKTEHELPTKSAPLSALDVSAAWRGTQLDESSWVWHIDAELVAELEAAARTALACGKKPEELSASDFDGPALRAQADRWLTELDSGLGFLLLRGLPVEHWGADLSAFAYLGLGLSIGTLCSQNAGGDLLGHIRDTGADPNDPGVRLYRTRKAQPFHTDGADIIGLLCLQPAKRGGASRIVSSISVLAEIHRKRPDLAPLLYQPFHFDRNNEQQDGEAPTFQLPIAHWDGKRVRVFYIGWYIRDAQRHTQIPRLTGEQNAVLDIFDATAADPALCLEMNFRPGDVQLLKNSSVLHGRSAYQDWDEPHRKRHLLRFWVAARSEFSGSDKLVQSGITKKPGAKTDSEAWRSGD